ncbi:MAG: AsmA family protein [Micropepsaceae bacterium]
MWRYLRWVLLAVVVLFFALIALPFLLPTDVYKAQIIAQARHLTGRDLKIDGTLKTTLFPELGIEVNNVRFANVDGGHDADMATMEQLVVGAELFPLLSGQVKVTRVTLVKPVIHLEVDGHGRGNWVFEGTASTRTAPTNSQGAKSDLNFQDVQLTDGTFTFRDARAHAIQTIENINASVQLPSLDKPMVYSGGLTWNKENVTMDATIAEPRKLAEGGRSAFNAKISADVMNASFDGTTDAGNRVVEGRVTFNTKSARRLARWLGVALPQVRGFGAMALAGDMTSSTGRVAFKNAKLSLDAMQGTGSLALDSTHATPLVKGDFTLDRLDINKYTGGGARDTSHGATSGGGWSNDVIDFSALKLVDADFDFAVNALEAGGLHVGRSVLDIALTGGKMHVKLKQLALYGGNGSGTIRLDGTSTSPTVGIDVHIGGVQGAPFLTDAAGFTRLSGTASIDLNVTAIGRSQNALMHSLGGKAAIRFTDGAIKGVNLAEIARTIQSALSGSAVGGSAKTDFAELSGSFAIRNGVAGNKDLKLLNPFVRLNGAGIIDLGGQTLDYRVEPKAVKSIEGQGGKSDLGGLGIPFRIHGSWGHPSYEPDLSGVVNSAVEDILQGKNPLQGVSGLGELIPGSGKKQQPTDPDKTAPKTKNDPVGTLNDLLGGGR